MQELYVDGHFAVPEFPHEHDNDWHIRKVISRIRSNTQTPSGVNVVGHFASEKGLGEAARSTVRSLKAARFPYILNNFTDVGSANQDTTFVDFSNDNPYNINLIHINAEQVPEFAWEKGESYFQDRYNIGYWFWELSTFPREWLSSFQYFDEIWVGSNFALDAISRVAPIPVVRIPLSVPKRSVLTQWNRAHFGIPQDKFIFLFIFDFASSIERKNPLGLVKIFKESFKRKDNVLLVLKCSHSEAFPAAFKALNEASKGDNVQIIDRNLSRDEINALLYLSDCYVSLHRSEGFGLPLAEAMSMGKPVIATSYSGNMDFMTLANSFLVKHNLIEIDEDHGPYKKGWMWANPDLDHAAELMRSVYKDQEFAKEVGQRARRDIVHSLHPRVVGGLIRERFAKVAVQQSLPNIRRPTTELQQAVVEILEVYLIKDPERLWGCAIDSPMPGNQPSIHPINIAGWVLGRNCRAVAVELVSTGADFERISIHVSRPDVAAIYTEVPGAETSGFRTTVSVPPTASEFELLMQVVLEDESRVPMGMIRARKCSLAHFVERQELQQRLQELSEEKAVAQHEIVELRQAISGQLEVVPVDASEQLWGCAIDAPVPERPTDRDEITVAGWVLGQSCSAVVVELVSAGITIRRVPIDISRWDVAANYPTVPRAELSGFCATVSVLELAREPELLIQAVLEDESRVPIGVIRRQRSATQIAEQQLQRCIAEQLQRCIQELSEEKAAAQREIVVLRQSVQNQASLLETLAAKAELLSSHEEELRAITLHIRAVVRTAVPSDATVIVVSKGDDELLELDGRQGWHFPQAEGGMYAGHHPADSAAAIAHLEALRASGGNFLVFPNTAFWWLGYYGDFHRHLDTQYQRIWSDERCIIYELSMVSLGVEKVAQVHTDLYDV